MNTAATLLRRDRSRQASPQVFEHLRERIIGMDLAPGTVLSRTELAQAYRLSQTPIRDALLRLGDEGLVDIFPQHATVVSRIDVQAARHAHFLRRSIECEIAQTLASAAPPALAGELRARIDVMAACAGEASQRAFIEADRAFHRLMYEAADVAELFDLVRRRSGHVDRLRLLHLPTAGKVKAILRDHRRIVDAIERGDPPGAQQAVREHLSGTLSRVEDIRRSHPDWLTA
jgi:GntR family transcriptional regulator, rspAB operon transcriptional repressor